MRLDIFIDVKPAAWNGIIENFGAFGKECSYFFCRTELLTVGSLSDVDDSSGNIGLLFPIWNFDYPYFLPLNINRIKFTFQRWRNLADRILNC